MIPLHDDNPTRRTPVVTVALIAANVVVFLYELSLGPAALEELFRTAGVVPYELVNRVDVPPPDAVPFWATVFTSMFLHGGWLHIAFNMLFLWVFGNNVEDAMGRVRFLVFYLLCGVIAALVQTAVRPQSLVPAIGASGAIAGVLGAYIVLFPRARVLSVLPVFVFFTLVYVPAWAVLILWFVLQVFQGTLTLGAESGVAFFAHIGGFVAGAGLVRLFARRPPRAHSWEGMY